MGTIQFSSHAVRIEQYSNFSDGPTVYSISTRDARGHAHAAHRRYSDFHALHLTLHAPGCAPSFPVPKLLFHSHAAQTQRMRDLENYLLAALSAGGDGLPRLLHFLGVREDAAAAATAADPDSAMQTAGSAADGPEEGLDWKDPPSIVAALDPARQPVGGRASTSSAEGPLGAWEELTNTNGTRYWWHAGTGETTYTRPDAVAPAAADAPDAAVAAPDSGGGAVAVPSAAATTDFGGSWLNTEVGGDVESFFKDGVGMGWAGRRALQAAGYGCGRITHDVTMGEGRRELAFTINLPQETTYRCRGLARMPRSRPAVRSSLSLAGTSSTARSARWTVGRRRRTSADATETSPNRPVRAESAVPSGCRYVCAWEEGALVTRSVGNATFDQRRYMDGDEMVNELSFPAKGGVSMTRRFVRAAS
jgi:hypothetical protein